MKNVRLEIPLSLYMDMICHAQEEWPLEACGILAGKDHRVERIFRMENEEKSEERFSISAEAQIRVLQELDRDELLMIGIYHSHPRTDPYPSERDRVYSFYPDVFHVIVSLKRREKPDVKVFLVEGDEVKSVDLIIS